MIESQYWRDELKVDIHWLRVKQNYKRWSEKQMVLFERKLMLVAFQVRSLLERPKVNGRAKALKLNGVRYAKIGSELFRLTGARDLEDHFDLSSPEAVQLPMWDVCNQLIHHYLIAAVSTGRGRFTSLIVFSDYNRRVCMYEFVISDVIELFSAFSDDASAALGGTWVWNEKKQDYGLTDAHLANDRLQSGPP